MLFNKIVIFVQITKLHKICQIKNRLQAWGLWARRVGYGGSKKHCISIQTPLHLAEPEPPLVVQLVFARNLCSHIFDRTKPNKFILIDESLAVFPICQFSVREISRRNLLTLINFGVQFIRPIRDFHWSEYFLWRCFSFNEMVIPNNFAGLNTAVERKICETINMPK